jgi:diguanylate cyclase (GGDEF)-like protein
VYRRVWYFYTFPGDHFRRWFWLVRWHAHLGEYRTDRTTGLRHWEEMQRELNHSSGSALLLDIDHLRLVNDHFGMRHSDQVLRQIAHVLVQETSALPFEGVRRYRAGGDEFMLLFPKTEIQAVRAIAEAVQARIAAAGIEAIPAAMPLPEGISSHELTATIAVLRYTSKEKRHVFLERAVTLVATGKQAGEPIVLSTS